MQTPEEHLGALIAAYEDASRGDRALCEPSVRVKVNWGALAAAHLIRERDAEVRADERAKALAGFTEERTDRMVARRVPCDCPGDWQHHGRFVGDDGPEMHAIFEAVPSRRLVGPWEPTP